IVPKVEPVLLDKEHQSLIDFYAFELQGQVSGALINDGMQWQGGQTSSVHMLFHGEVAQKDVDNLARAYYPILLQLGVLDRDVHTLHLRKEHVPSKKQYTRIIVQ